jgi:Cu/Ag efflux pump CusA
LLWPPLAIVMIGGLGLTTLITLVGVPSAYLLLTADAAGGRHGRTLKSSPRS